MHSTLHDTDQAKACGVDLASEPCETRGINQMAAVELTTTFSGIEAQAFNEPARQAYRIGVAMAVGLLPKKALAFGSETVQSIEESQVAAS